MTNSFQKSKIIIAGGSGLVGNALRVRLETMGAFVHVLSRSSADEIYRWNPDSGEINPRAIQDADFIINLAGANIAGALWTQSYKRQLLNSRINSTKTLVEALKKTSKKPQHFIQASAIGFYSNSDDWVDETHASGTGFICDLVSQWEKSCQEIANDAIPLSIIRIGIVLEKNSGYLGKSAIPARMGLSSAFGSGNQFISWIHIDDLVSLFIWIMENRLTGTYNAVADEPVSQKEMTRALAKALHRPYFLPNVPANVLKLLLGEFSKELLANHKVSNKKTKDLGFVFQYPNIAMALKNIYGG